MNPRKIGRILLYSMGALVVLMLALMLGIKLALDRAPQYQAQIKDWVFRRTGYHVAFAHVSPAFRWYGPELYFDQMELRTKDDQHVLAHAAGGRIDVDIWHLLQNGKLFGLRVELDSPNIVIARLGPTTFALGSEVVLGGDDGSLSELRLNQLPAGTLVIRRGFVTIQDWNAALPRLDLSAVNLDVTRGSDLISFALSAQLPTALGGRFSLSGAAHGAGPMADAEWNALASASGMSFPGWRELLPEYLTRLDAGTGGFEAQMAGRGSTLARAVVDFGAQGVVTKLADGPTTRFEQVSGALTLTHTGDRWGLLGRRLRALREGRSDPNSEFDVSWRATDPGLLELHAKANYLHADALLPLVGLMPQKDLRERLRDVAPTGEWTDMRLSLERRSVNDPWHFDAHAKFHGVGFAPVGHSPGVRGLSGALEGNDAGGHVILDTQTAVLYWPEQFSQPIGLPVLKTNLYWKHTADEILVATSDLELRTRDIEVRGKMAWRQPSDGGSPVLTMASAIDNGNAGDARFYFPRGIMAPAALQWLDRAFVAGHVSHGDAVFRGPVQNFPFRDGSGLFLIRFRIDHLILDYREGWPRIENLAAQAEFRNEGMTVKVASAAAGDLKVDSADARFVDFKNGELQIHAAAHGDAADALHYLAATPLDAMAENAFSTVEAKGALRSTVDLFFPFKQFDKRRVLVHVDLGGATLNRSGSTLAASDLTGEADIDGAQVVHADVRGRVLGGGFQMSARVPRNRPVTRTQLEFRGTASGESLRAALSLPASAPIGGQADWHGVLRIAPEPTRERSLHVTSTLAGLDLNFPAPLAKPAGTPMPTSIDVQWPASGGAQLRASLGSVLRGALNLDSDAGGLKLGHAAVAFGGGDPVFSDAQAVNVEGTIDELDLTGWLKLGAGAPKGAKPLATYLRTARIAVGRVDFLGLSFLDVGLALTENGGGWRVQAEGPNTAGVISLPSPQEPSAPWDLEFTRLKFIDAEVPGTAADAKGAEPKSVPDSKSATDPRSIPAISFHAADLIWGDRQFGDVRATLVKLDDGISLKQLTVSNAAFEASARGEWRGSSSRVQGTITSTDVGDTLKQLGFDPVIEAKSGRLDFDMNWVGAPTADSLEAATGHVQLALDKGQIVGLKPGAGRLLGLASMAELRRRLALDFSDLTDKGFAFDTVRGDFDVHDGNANTDNVLVKGPAAEIGLIGRVGLKNHDYDQTAVVTGSVAGSSLPLAAFVAGPVVGGVVLLFSQVFKQPLKGLVRGYYRITGSWDNPTVERIKSADAPTASVEAPK
jgi:uncharacterized protein (TIGR02099 family)